MSPFMSRNSVAFPQFSGENPSDWLYAMEDVFEELQVPMEKYVDIAMHCLHGAARKWAWNWVFLNPDMALKGNWCAFSYQLLWEFDPTTKVQEEEESIVGIKENKEEESIVDTEEENGNYDSLATTEQAYLGSCENAQPVTSLEQRLVVNPHSGKDKRLYECNTGLNMDAHDVLLMSIGRFLAITDSPSADSRVLLPTISKSSVVTSPVAAKSSNIAESVRYIEQKAGVVLTGGWSPTIAILHTHLHSLKRQQQYRILDTFKGSTCSTLSGIGSKCGRAKFLPDDIHSHHDSSVSSIINASSEEHHLYGATVINELEGSSNIVVTDVRQPWLSQVFAEYTGQYNNFIHLLLWERKGIQCFDPGTVNRTWIAVFLDQRTQGIILNRAGNYDYVFYKLGERQINKKANDLSVGPSYHFCTVWVWNVVVYSAYPSSYRRMQETNNHSIPSPQASSPRELSILVIRGLAILIGWNGVTMDVADITYDFSKKTLRVLQGHYVSGSDHRQILGIVILSQDFRKRIWISEWSNHSITRWDPGIFKIMRAVQYWNMKLYVVGLLKALKGPFADHQRDDLYLSSRFLLRTSSVTISSGMNWFPWPPKCDRHYPDYIGLCISGLGQIMMFVSRIQWLDHPLPKSFSTTAVFLQLVMVQKRLQRRNFPCTSVADCMQNMISQVRSTPSIPIYRELFWCFKSLITAQSCIDWVVLFHIAWGYASEVPPSFKLINSSDVSEPQSAVLALLKSSFESVFGDNINVSSGNLPKLSWSISLGFPEIDSYNDTLAITICLNHLEVVNWALPFYCSGWQYFFMKRQDKWVYIHLRAGLMTREYQCGFYSFYDCTSGFYDLQYIIAQHKDGVLDGKPRYSVLLVVSPTSGAGKVNSRVDTKKIKDKLGILWHIVMHQLIQLVSALSVVTAESIRCALLLVSPERFTCFEMGLCILFLIFVSFQGHQREFIHDIITGARMTVFLRSHADKFGMKDGHFSRDPILTHIGNDDAVIWGFDPGIVMFADCQDEGFDPGIVMFADCQDFIGDLSGKHLIMWHLLRHQWHFFCMFACPSWWVKPTNTDARMSFDPGICPMSVCVWIMDELQLLYDTMSTKHSIHDDDVQSPGLHSSRG